jgi:hypothetical protein
MNKRALVGLCSLWLSLGCSSTSGSGPDAASLGGSGGSGGGGAGGHTGGYAGVGVAVTPAGALDGAATQTLVSPAGGTVVSADGKLKLEVPAGALAAAQMLSVAPIKNLAPGGVGPAYRLTPDGQTFSVPVNLVFAYDDADVGSSEALAWRIAYQDAMGRWNSLKSVTLDVGAKTVTVQTSHFTDWAKVLAWRLDPKTATVHAGDGVELAVVACDVSTTVGADPLAALLDTCQPDPALFSVSGWAVNDIAGGDADVGTVVASSPGTGHYTAPAAAPTPNPVRVTATSVDVAGRMTKLASEILWVGDKDHPSYMGTVTSTTTEPGGLTITTSADATFVWDIVNGWYIPGSGMMTATWDIVAATCHTHGVFQGPLGGRDGQIIVNSGIYLPEGQKMGDYVGTATCAAGAPEPFTRSDDINWWPSPLDLLFVKPDGSLEDSFDETNADTGKEVKAQWRFVKAP